MHLRRPKPLILSPLEEVVSGLCNETARAELWDQLAETRHLKEPQINAFEQITSDLPKGVSGPFNGLPITVKDQIAVAGWPRWFGLEKTTKTKDGTSAPFVKTLQDMGCVVQGKTALPPHALDLQTFNARRGPTENPHRMGFTVGGSSGGGAAAVASGMSLLEIGADLAGSLRLPASWCGVSSLVPTEGRFDTNGMLPKDHLLDHFGRMGPVARSCNELAFFWKTLTGETHPTTPNQNARLLIWSSIDQAPMEQHVCDLWSWLGKTLIENSFLVEWDCMSALFHADIRKLFGEIMGYETGAMLPFFMRWLLRRDTDAIARSPQFLKHVYQGYRRDHRQYAKNLKRLEALRQNMLQLLETCDALILPVSGIAAFPHTPPIKERGGVRTYDKEFQTLAGPLPYLAALTYFTVPTGVLGWPIVTLPFAVDHNGVPMGFQLVGKSNEEAKLLSIACALEQAMPFASTGDEQ